MARSIIKPQQVNEDTLQDGDNDNGGSATT